MMGLRYGREDLLLKNHAAIADFLWKIADLIKDDYEAADYEDVILPFTLLRRLDCVLQPTREAAREAAGKYRALPPETRAKLISRAAGQPFYNTSAYSLDELIRVPADISANFRAYLEGFSDNVKDIFYNFSGGEEKGLGPIYETLARKRLLLKVTQAFSEVDLSPENVDNHAMGTIFEYLIRKFKEARNEGAGQFYTPRDIIQLMVKLLFEPDRAKLAKMGQINIYDPACGTGGMLTTAKEHVLAAIKPDLGVYLYGQELNEKTYAIAKADMLMKGEDPENIKRENTLTNDMLPGRVFNYMMSNPPFGSDWKKIREEVEEEHRRGAAGRYGPGLPDVGDGAMLFLLHKMFKMAPQDSKIGIIFNGSPLFNGDAGSGPSNIRRHIIENDLLDCIVGMPTDLFYNTGIATYIWILSNRKPPERRGKVQLINATGEEFRTLLRRNLGKKRFDISEEQSNAILAIYEAFEETKLSKIFDNADFGYTKVTVERPLRLRWELTPERIASLPELAEVKKLTPERRQSLQDTLTTLAGRAPWKDTQQFVDALTPALSWKPSTALLKALRSALAVKDEEAAPVVKEGPLLIDWASPEDMESALCTGTFRDGEGNCYQYEPDPALRDYENVPLKEDVEDYFLREVRPHVPDAWMDRAKDKIGYEVSFTRYFYEFTPLRSTAEIAEELLALDAETENLLREVVR